MEAQTIVDSPYPPFQVLRLRIQNAVVDYTINIKDKTEQVGILGTIDDLERLLVHMKANEPAHCKFHESRFFFEMIFKQKEVFNSGKLIVKIGDLWNRSVTFELLNDPTLVEQLEAVRDTLASLLKSVNSVNKQ